MGGVYLELTAEMQARVAALLGREPRGLREVLCGASGEPQVIRVAALVDDKPFPTLYWLVDAQLNLRIDRAEAGGLIAELQARVDADPALQASMAADHAVYIARRTGFCSLEESSRIEALGYAGVLAAKGIGGIGDFTRIR
ncbi:MAG: DUF501 domain-containing protein, partial [Halioglobus sp.]|nr:DUF501 domain-containing protein [Halioglobus sp.]